MVLLWPWILLLLVLSASILNNLRFNIVILIFILILVLIREVPNQVNPTDLAMCYLVIVKVVLALKAFLVIHDLTGSLWASFLFLFLDRASLDGFLIDMLELAEIEWLNNDRVLIRWSSLRIVYSWEITTTYLGDFSSLSFLVLHLATFIIIRGFLIFDIWVFWLRGR